jgi:hypothetical protein
MFLVYYRIVDVWAVLSAFEFFMLCSPAQLLYGLTSKFWLFVVELVFEWWPSVYFPAGDSQEHAY